MQSINYCPSCDSKKLNKLFNCIDHFFTNETFELLLCENCQLIITNPQPNSSELPHYYNTEKYISHQANAKSLMDYIYMMARQYSLNQKVKIIKNESTEKTLFDYGCGTGDFLVTCKKKGFTTCGFEPTLTARNTAIQRTGDHIYENQTEINTKNKFGIVTLWHVLEHIPNLMETINLLKNLTTEKGKIIIALPNYDSYDAHYYGNFWAAYDVPRHLYHFNPISMKKLLHKNKLHIEKIIPMWLDSYYISLLSEKYVTGRNIILKSIINGYKSNVYGKKTGNYSSLIYITSKC